MKIPKFDDLKTCSECKHPFKVKDRKTTTKKCYCSEYVFNFYPTPCELLLAVKRSMQNGKDVYIISCNFGAVNGKNPKLPLITNKQEIFSCYIKLFLNGNPSPINIEIPEGMLEKVPIFENNKKMIKFCDLVRILK